MADHIACHLLHGKPRQIGAARIQAFFQAEKLNLFSDPHNLIHAPDGQIHPVLLLNAKAVRNHHQLLHIARHAAILQDGIEEDRKQRDHTVQDVGNVPSVHAPPGNQQRRESRDTYDAIEGRKEMNQSLFVRYLPIADKMHADDAERHAERKDLKGPDCHQIDRSGRIAVKLPCEGHRQQDNGQRNRAHQRHKATEQITHHIRKRLTVLLSDADAQKHA